MGSVGLGNIGNILAVRLGPQMVMGNGAVDTGLRAILAVTIISADIQTYTIYGNSLYMIHYDVGQLNCEDAFAYFTKQFYNKSVEWDQLSAPPPNPLLLASQIYLVNQPPPPAPVAFGNMTLLNSGYNPLKGYWLQFSGNFDNTCPLFSGWPSVTRNIPNYQIRQG